MTHNEDIESSNLMTSQDDSELTGSDPNDGDPVTDDEYQTEKTLVMDNGK